MNKLFIIPLLCVSCIIVPVDPYEPEAAHCVTPNSDYSESYVETAGTCGPRNQSTLGVGPDGQVLLGQGVMCQVATVNECSATHLCTMISSAGCQINFDSNLTFVPDGTSFTGVEQIEILCPNGTYCASQYSVRGNRH